LSQTLLGPVVRNVLQVMVPDDYKNLDDWHRSFSGNAEASPDVLLQAVTEAQVAHDRGVKL
jgi:hypothetical protein